MTVTGAVMVFVTFPGASDGRSLSFAFAERMNTRGRSVGAGRSPFQGVVQFTQRFVRNGFVDPGAVCARVIKLFLNTWVRAGHDMRLLDLITRSDCSRGRKGNLCRRADASITSADTDAGSQGSDDSNWDGTRVVFVLVRRSGPLQWHLRQNSRGLDSLSSTHTGRSSLSRADIQ
jgi:hypothetical protein